MNRQSFAITPSRLLVFFLLLICSPLMLLLRIGYGVSFGVLTIAAWFISIYGRIFILKIVGTIDGFGRLSLGLSFLKPEQQQKVWNDIFSQQYYSLHLFDFDLSSYVTWCRVYYSIVAEIWANASTDASAVLPPWAAIIFSENLAKTIATYEIYLVGFHAFLIAMRMVMKKDYKYHTAYIGFPTIPITRKFDKKLLWFVVFAPGLAYFFPEYLKPFVDYMWIPPLAVMGVAYIALLNLTRADNTLSAFDPIQFSRKPPKKRPPSIVKLARMPKRSRENLNAIFSRRPEGLARLASVPRDAP